MYIFEYQHETATQQSEVMSTNSSCCYLEIHASERVRLSVRESMLLDVKGGSAGYTALPISCLQKSSEEDSCTHPDEGAHIFSEYAARPTLREAFRTIL